MSGALVAAAIGGSAIIGAGVSLYEGSQTANAISKQQDLLNNLQYQPIDIAALQKTATETSINDAINSLALQRKLQPAVVRSNEELQKSVADQLALGGQVPADVANQVAQAGRTSTGISGATGNAAPITAALLGTTSLNLLNQRQQAATNLAAANPAPSVGLSAQDIASAMEANNNATNQFNIAKAGGQASLINSTAQNNAGTAAGVGSSLNQALTLMALLGGKSTSQTPLTPAQSTAVAGATNQQFLGGAPTATSGTIITGV